jgi:hypothetical protein
MLSLAATFDVFFGPYSANPSNTCTSMVRTLYWPSNFARLIKNGRWIPLVTMNF